VTIWSEQDRQQIFGSLDTVGNAKPLGYLPLRTVEKHLSMNICDVVSSFEGRGLKAKAFSPDECCINTGALYVYDPVALQSVLNGAQAVLERNGWPVVAESFVDCVAKSWIEPSHPVHPVIRQAFGDLR
jgi:hypothetical protein